MNIALWIAAGVLALVNLGAGVLKIVTPYETIAQNPNFGWVRDYRPTTVKNIGILELLAGIGLVLPQLTGIAQVLTPLAAVGVALLQASAFGVHSRRSEWKILPINIILMGLSVFVAFGRFG